MKNQTWREVSITIFGEIWAHGNVRASVTENRGTGRGCDFRDFDLRYRYGFQWWVFEDPRDGFTGWGSGGQFLHIFSEQEVVVVQFSKWDTGAIDDRRSKLLGFTA